jgi:hypothetical protein
MFIPSKFVSTVLSRLRVLDGRVKDTTGHLEK